MEIRAAKAMDVPRLAAIDAASSSSPWAEAAFTAELAGSAGPAARTLEVAAEAGAVRGFICYWAVAGEVHLLNVAVEPAVRRRGIGRALLRHLIERAAELRAHVIRLEVRAGNAAARSLYAAAGFCEVGLRRGYYPGGEDAVLLDLEGEAR